MRTATASPQTWLRPLVHGLLLLLAPALLWANTLENIDFTTLPG
jgi:hypothetical protein